MVKWPILLNFEGQLQWDGDEKYRLAACSLNTECGTCSQERYWVLRSQSKPLIISHSDGKATPIKVAILQAYGSSRDKPAQVRKNNGPVSSLMINERMGFFIFGKIEM